MAISETARNDLYNGLRDLLGPDRAATLMSGLALHEFDVVATKADLADLRAELKTEIAELRAEFAGLRAEFADLRAEFKSDLARLQRTIIGWMVSLVAANIAALIGVGLLT